MGFLGASGTIGARITMNARVLLLIVAGLLPAADKSKDNLVDKDIEFLRGGWYFVTPMDGADDDKSPGSIVFTKDKMTIRLPGAKEATAYPYQIKPGNDPKQIDVLYPEVMKADARRLGIYSIERDGEKDRLKICLAISFDQARPKDFTVKRNNEVFVLERHNMWW
jgi:uncharacterized protein (TIGR03067 family)